jgi:hypothetical protein
LAAAPDRAAKIVVDDAGLVDRLSHAADAQRLSHTGSFAYDVAKRRITYSSEGLPGQQCPRDPYHRRIALLVARFSRCFAIEHRIT